MAVVVPARQACVRGEGRRRHFLGAVPGNGGGVHGNGGAVPGDGGDVVGIGLSGRHVEILYDTRIVAPTLYPGIHVGCTPCTDHPCATRTSRTHDAANRPPREPS
ncbi:hypothetical protein E2651_28965 [Streptomyces sp. MZ04]|nr:hypothetical protein E2651_28965 [Streptomyces sp. MZ04]